MNWLNYQHLFYFWNIAREGSLAGASQKLRLGHSALSIQLKQLETHFQQKLFERKNKKLHLTEAGKVALDYANHIFQLGDELSEVMSHQTTSRRSPIHIGVLEGVPKRLVQLLITDAQKENTCNTIVRQGESDLIFRELLAHRIDLVVSDCQPSMGDSRNFHCKHLVKAPVSVFSAKKFRDLKENFPQSLRGMPIILPTFHSKLRHDLDHYLRINNIVVDVVTETSDTSVQKILALEGMGVVPLPDCAAHSLIEAAKLIKIAPLPKVTVDYYLTHSPRKIHNPMVLNLAENFEITI